MSNKMTFLTGLSIRNVINKLGCMIFHIHRIGLEWRGLEGIGLERNGEERIGTEWLKLETQRLSMGVQDEGCKK